MTAVAETVDRDVSVAAEALVNAPMGRRAAVGFTLAAGALRVGAKARAAERADADV